MYWIEEDKCPVETYCSCGQRKILSQNLHHSNGHSSCQNRGCVRNASVNAPRDNSIDGRISHDSDPQLISHVEICLMYWIEEGKCPVETYCSCGQRKILSQNLDHSNGHSSFQNRGCVRNASVNPPRDNSIDGRISHDSDPQPISHVEICLMYWIEEGKCPVETYCSCGQRKILSQNLDHSNGHSSCQNRGCVRNASVNPPREIQ